MEPLRNVDSKMVEQELISGLRKARALSLIVLLLDHSCETQALWCSQGLGPVSIAPGLRNTINRGPVSPHVTEALLLIRGLGEGGDWFDKKVEKN